ncbi:unnamed protein product [marine sediment metagenome]|uniref:Uncharacterized protein n=1 Tax=marine sediment metagenome TaxID=412755 RepID=X1IZA1_9ZZZZ
MGIFDKLFGKKRENIGYFCAKCGVRWNTETMEMLYGGAGLVAGMITPGSNQYTGRCPKCEKLYCARCASSKGITLQCPDCNVDLKAALHG